MNAQRYPNLFSGVIERALAYNWIDAALSKNTTVEYYDNVVAVMGGQSAADVFVRFYVAPGVNHCAGGPGADTTDLLAALDGWVTARRRRAR